MRPEVKKRALAITSELLTELMADTTHTPKDTIEIVDPAKLVTVAFALRDLLLDLDQSVQANRREVG